MLLRLLFILGTSRFFPASTKEISIVRHEDGDVFMVEGFCDNICGQVSGALSAAPYVPQLPMGLSRINTTCICQCKSNTPIFREDLNICVSDIHECQFAGFLSSSGAIERVPYVFLPQYGQIIYPQSEILFEGARTSVCGIVGAQQLGKSGWSELRNITRPGPPFTLFHDKGRSFLKWTGETALREAAEGKVVITQLTCRDAAPNASSPETFTPCMAFRIAGSPTKSVIREVSFAHSTSGAGGLSSFEYSAIAISSVLLALIYVVSVALYLHSQKSRRKKPADPETTNVRGGSGIVKTNPLLASKVFETDSNSVRSDSDHEEHVSPGDIDSGTEKVTSAIVHRHLFAMQTEAPHSPQIIAERIPDEGVRIVEIFDGAQPVDNSLLPGMHRRKLFFNPAYFERHFLLAPPPAAVEFLLKIREIISIAKHKMWAKRFVPSLSGIPEEESLSERCSSSKNKRRDSVQDYALRSRRYKKCTGCPGCTDLYSKYPVLIPDNSRAIPGESRVRAWLADVEPPERPWKDVDDQLDVKKNVRTFATSPKYLQDPQNVITSSECRNSTGSLSSWKDNHLMSCNFQHITRSEIMGDNDQCSISRRSTKSMFENSNRDRFYRTKKHQLTRSAASDEFLSDQVRQAIENSFIKQMEENAALESQILETERHGDEQSLLPDCRSDETTKESLELLQHVKKTDNIIKPKKSQSSSLLMKDLPDMIPDLPTSKFPVKTIMDAVIKEMVVVKALEHHQRLSDYEVDSLERTNRRESEKQQLHNVKNSAASTDAFPMNSEREKSTRAEEETTKIVTNNDVLMRNYYNAIPELIPQRAQDYSLVSEVYVNDGYASPANSDDSGPEISYEPENPGHLTIKVQDAPENYVKHAESEYESDTLDRKSMRFKVNSDIIYEHRPSYEFFPDSLERPGQTVLKSKSNFRIDRPISPNRSLSMTYGSGCELYESELKAYSTNPRSTNSNDGVDSRFQENGTWESPKYLTPDLRQMRRQRKQNQPDVVPTPPGDLMYAHSRPAERIDDSKNDWDRSLAEAGTPTAGVRPPVHTQHQVGMKTKNGVCQRTRVFQGYSIKNFNDMQIRKVEDSGYLSNTDSTDSPQRVIKYDFPNISETDETESMCDAASESGAESIGTDSVFFDNVRKVSQEGLSTSADRGMDVKIVILK